MKFTTGQKNALSRKVNQILEEKRAKAREEIKKNFKLSSEQQEIFNNIKEIEKAREAYKNAVMAAGFTFKYSCINPKSDFSFSLYHESELPFDEQYLNFLVNEYIQMEYKDPYPNEFDVMDELELQTLSKDFDVEAFLEKYKNM